MKINDNDDDRYKWITMLVTASKEPNKVRAACSDEHAADSCLSIVLQQYVLDRKGEAQDAAPPFGKQQV